MYIDHLCLNYTQALQTLSRLATFGLDIERDNVE